MENLLNKQIPKKYGTNKGSGISGLILGIVVGVILVIAVAIPIAKEVTTSANLTGTTKTVVEIIPIMLAIIPIVMIAQTF